MEHDTAKVGAAAALARRRGGRGAGNMGPAKLKLDGSPRRWAAGDCEAQLATESLAAR